MVLTLRIKLFNICKADITVLVITNLVNLQLLKWYSQKVQLAAGPGRAPPVNHS